MKMQLNYLSVHLEYQIFREKLAARQNAPIGRVSNLK